MDFNSIFFVHLFALLIFQVQESEECSGRMIRFGRHVIRDLFNDLKINITKPSKWDYEEEEKKLDKIRKSIRTLILPESEYFKERGRLNMLTMYTDETGCYEKGFSKEYRGIMDHTETSRQCSKWSVFTTMLESKLSEYVEARDKANNFSITKLERTDEELKRYHDSSIGIDIINNTINIVKDKGVIFHNFCRDPDGVGKPWCFVKTKNDLHWEFCPVPLCTKCWRIRQRAVRGRFKSFRATIRSLNKWIPECTFEGDFHHTQCWRNYCWCVTEEGNFLKGTLKKKGPFGSNCEQIAIKAKNRRTLTKRKKVKPWYIKESMTPDEYERRKQMDQITNKVYIGHPNEASDKDTKRVEIRKLQLDKARDNRRHKCEIKYFFTREIRCREGYCWVTIRRNILAWSCFQDMNGKYNERYIIWFSRGPNLSGSGSKFSGGKWKCIFFKDKAGRVQKKCTLLCSMSYRIRRDERKTSICFTIHDAKDGEKEICKDF